MKIVSVVEFHALLETKEIKSASLLKEALRETMKLYKFQFDVKWIKQDALEEECIKYAESKGWDLDKALVIYVPPQDVKPNTDDAEVDQILQSISKLNTDQCVCWFMSDMTVEKFANTINRIVKLGVFL